MAKKDSTAASIERDNHYMHGAQLAADYIRVAKDRAGDRTLITAMETAAAAGSEAVRGLGEKLHEYIAAILKPPAVGAPTVRQQLQDVVDCLPEIHGTLESIHLEAEARIEDAPFGLFSHTARRGMDLTDLIESMLEDIQHHRPSRDTETAGKAR